MAWEKADGHKNSRNGYNTKTVTGRYGDVTIRIPRDRNGHFSPRLLPRWKRNLDYLDTRIHQIYAIFFSSDSTYTGERYARLMREIGNLYVGTLSRDELCEIARCLRKVSFEHRDALKNVTYEQTFSLDSMNVVDNTRWWGGYSLDSYDRYHFRPYPRPVPKYTSNWGQGLASIAASCGLSLKAKRIRKRRRVVKVTLKRKLRTRVLVETNNGRMIANRVLSDIPVLTGLSVLPFIRLSNPANRSLPTGDRSPVSRTGFSRENHVNFSRIWAKARPIARMYTNVTFKRHFRLTNHEANSVILL